MKKVWKIFSLVLVFALVMAPMASLAVDTISPNGNFLSGQTDLVGKIAGTVQWVGYGIAIVMVFWLGIQWILSTPSKKAELKGRMWSMAIGILLLVAGATIVGTVWGISADVGSQMGGSGDSTSALPVPV